jgi:hypothetical protein
MNIDFIPNGTAKIILKPTSPANDTLYALLEQQKAGNYPEISFSCTTGVESTHGASGGAISAAPENSSGDATMAGLEWTLTFPEVSW